MLWIVVGPVASGRQSITEWLLQVSTQNSFPQQILVNDPTMKSLTLTDDKTLSFSSVHQMTLYVTTHWLDHFVWYYPKEGLTNKEEMEQLLRRPFVGILAVDAPLSLRFQRQKLAWNEFLIENDTFYKDPFSAYQLSQRAHIRLLNHETLQQLYVQLQDLNPFDAEWLRPSWDTYFMRMTFLAASRSNCMKRRVGALLIRDYRLLSTGYNGTPHHLPNCNQGGCVRCNGAAVCGTGLQSCLCLHAEENALIEAGRARSMGSTLYCTTCPCLGCARLAVNAGVIRVVYGETYAVDEKSRMLMEQAGLSVEQWDSNKI